MGHSVDAIRSHCIGKLSGDSLIRALQKVSMYSGAVEWRKGRESERRGEWERWKRCVFFSYVAFSVIRPSSKIWAIKLTPLKVHLLYPAKILRR